MERAAWPLLRTEPSPRAARKSQWLRSALSHHHCPDPGAENEIVVLATGMDQYLQEVFHHLAYPNQDDTVTAEDFSALCAVLGLAAAGRRTRARAGGHGEKIEEGEEEEEDEEMKDVCSTLPCRLSFKDFHSRLCGYFRVRSTRRGTGDGGWRVPATEDTELVQRQIRVRWPRVRRRKCVSFDLSREQSGHTPPGKGGTAGAREPDEVSALRELVEDLRSALQGSDARCLALEVALRRDRSRATPFPPSTSASSTTPTSITFDQGKLVPTHRIRGTGGAVGRRPGRTQDIRDPLLRELKLIRSSRDGQLEEAIRFNQRLEKELQWAYQEVRKLQGGESALRKENAQIRRRAEEAREALSLGLQRVRLIQEQAHTVPQLQARINQLETELQQYRSRCSCLLESARQQIRTDAECLQRAVEGRAASDEEEEEVEEGGRREEGLAEVKKPVARVHGCGKGCRDHVVTHLVSQSHLQDKVSVGNPGWRRPNQEKRLEDEEDEEDERRREEKDKTRLFLLEEKLTDALTLLLQLHNKSLSRRVLGQIVMDALDVCSRGGDGPARVLQVAGALRLQLSPADVLRDGGEDGRGGGDSREKLLNPLLISC